MQLNETNNDLSGTFDDGSSTGDEPSRTMSGSNSRTQVMRPLIPLRVRTHVSFVAQHSSTLERNPFMVNPIPRSASLPFLNENPSLPGSTEAREYRFMSSDEGSVSALE